MTDQGDRALPREQAPAALPSTGVTAVDDALLELAGLDGAPVAEHPERLQRVHAALQEALDSDRSAPLG